MINIKELSVGNWIKISGTPVQILGIRTESQVYVLETEEADYAYAIDADIEPIEITPEILEKNGFKYHAFMSDYPADYVLAEDYYSIIVNEVTDGLYQFKIFGEEIINTTEIIHASYVHQLQNALTLCGINKEIEL